MDLLIELFSEEIPARMQARAREDLKRLITDGLVEGRDLPLDEGIGRLRAALADLGDQPLDRLCDAVIERMRPERLRDDIALVAIRLHQQG